MKRTTILLILVMVVALALPYLLQNEYLLRLAVLSGLFILVASGHNILMKVGQLSLGPVAFYGIGAYVSAILTTRFGVPFLVAFLAAGLVSAAAGWGIGRLTLRLRKAYFVLVTIGFAEFFRLIALNWTEVTNGPMGITAIPAPSTWFVGYQPYYYAILALVVVVLFALWRMENSTIGRAMHAIRENETLGLSVGIDSYHYMMVAAVISSFIIGLSGSFYAHFFQFVGPELLSFDLTMTIVIMVIAGGRATLAGPVFGAILFTIIPEMLRAATVWRMVIYGLLLVFIMLFMPDGILPTLVRLFERARSQWLPGIKKMRQPQAPQQIVPVQADVRKPALGSQPNPEIMLVGETPLELIDSASTKPVLGPKLLELNEVCVYFGGLHAVERLTLDVCQGEILAVIGPNGAGKTTLLNAITRLGPISTGSITYQGNLLNPLTTHQVARSGLVRTFQHTSVFPGISTRQNLVLAHNLLESNDIFGNLARSKKSQEADIACQRRADEVLEMLNLRSYADQTASALPYGNQRMLELGISLMTNPKLLLLDEPAAGMNSSEVEMLMRLILNIRDQGVTILLVEHDMKLVMGISDRIFVLNYGKQIAMGRPDEIQRNEEVISAYLGRRKAHAAA